MHGDCDYEGIMGWGRTGPWDKFLLDKSRR